MSRLTLTRRCGESVVILGEDRDHDVIVTLKEVQSGRAKLVIDAHADAAIWRSELLEPGETRDGGEHGCPRE